jgi:hypothetical protein
MKAFFLLLTACGLARVVSAQPAVFPPALTPTNHIELFNGRDFSGFTFCMKGDADPMKTWSVTNGVIHCAGKPIGYIRTLQTYANYVLTVEWRFLKVVPKTGDNTGVLVHMQLPDQVWSECMQVQGKHDHQGDLFMMMGAESKEHKGMNANTPVPLHGGVPNEHPVGQWDVVKTVCRTATTAEQKPGGVITAYVNDKLMNVTTECTLTSGFIGIQSEGGDIEIRKMSLDPLPN